MILSRYYLDDDNNPDNKINKSINRQLSQFFKTKILNYLKIT